MTERIPRVVEGDNLSARWLNRVGVSTDELNDAIQRERDAPDLDQHVGHLMTITDVAGTALLAIAGTAAPVGGETVFTVRLPPELVEAARDGVAITVTDVNNATATDGVALETWRMVKSYAVNDIIEAFYWELDGVFVDRNIAARMWAAVPVVSGGGG